MIILVVQPLATSTLAISAEVTPPLQVLDSIAIREVLLHSLPQWIKSFLLAWSMLQCLILHQTQLCQLTPLLEKMFSVVAWTSARKGKLMELVLAVGLESCQANASWWTTESTSTCKLTHCQIIACSQQINSLIKTSYHSLFCSTLRN